MNGRVLPSSNSARAPATWRGLSESSVATCWTSDGESTAWGGGWMRLKLDGGGQPPRTEEGAKGRPFSRRMKALDWHGKTALIPGYTDPRWCVLIETGEADERDRRGAVGRVQRSGAALGRPWPGGRGRRAVPRCGPRGRAAGGRQPSSGDQPECARAAAAAG